MADDPENSDFIVVNDGSPRIGPDGEDLTSAPPTVSKSLSPPTRLQGPGRQSSSKKSDFNDTLDPLRALPELRAIPWYEGKELPTDKAIESPRVQTRGACLLASRGRVVDPPCSHCQNGVGRFSQCIALDDWFHGACATCQLATRGNLCSLRKDKSAVKSESEQQESPSAEMPSARKGRPRKQRPSSSTLTARSQISPADQSQSKPREPGLVASSSTGPSTSYGPIAPLQDATRPADEYISQFRDRPTPPLKRKREALQETSAYRPYVSPYAPMDLPNRLTSTSLPNTPIISSTPNMILPANITRNPLMYNDYINQQNGTGRQQPVENPKPGFQPINGNGNGHRNSGAVIETGRNSKQVRGGDADRDMDRDRTDSLSPSASAQLLDRSNRPLQSPTPEPPSRKPSNPTPNRMTTRNTNKRNLQGNGTTASPNTSRNLETPGIALIDNLPRRKQKQIYSLIGGLQSGIRSCQQQAGNMQKQLDLLQAALGIDTDDDKDVPMNG